MTDHQTTERQREIAQGLRDKNGALIGGLVVFDYLDGIRDWKAGTPPPQITSTSYDLGRSKAARDAEIGEEHRDLPVCRRPCGACSGGSRVRWSCAKSGTSI